MRSLILKRPKFFKRFYSNLKELQDKLPSINDKDEKWKHIYNISQLLIKESNFKDAKQYLKENFELSSKIGNPYLEFVSLLTLGDVYVNLNEPENAFNTYQLLYDKVQSHNNSSVEFSALIGLGYSKKMQNDFQECHIYYQMALGKAKDDKSKAFLLEKMIELDIQKNALEDAKTHTKEAITCFLKLDDMKGLEQFLISVGTMFLNDKHLQLGGDMLDILIELNEENRIDSKLIPFLKKYLYDFEQLASELYEKKSFLEAKKIHLILSSILEYEPIKDVKLLKTFQKLAICYFEIRKFESSKKYFEKTLEIMIELGIDKENQYYPKVEIARCFYYLNEMEKSKELFFEIEKECSMSNYLEKVYYYLSLIGFNQMDYGFSNKYIEKGLEIIKKTKNEELGKLINNIEKRIEIHIFYTEACDLYKEEKYKLSKELFEKSIKLAKDISPEFQFDLFFNYSKIMLDVNNDNESERYFVKCLDLVESKKLPKEYKLEVLKYLCIVEERLDRYHQALGYYEQSMNLRPYNSNEDYLKIAEMYFINEYYSKSLESCGIILEYEIDEEIIRKTKLLLMRLEIMNTNLQKAKEFLSSIELNDEQRDYYSAILEVLKSGKNNKFLEIFHKNEVKKMMRNTFVKSDFVELTSFIPKEHKHVFDEILVHLIEE